MSFSGQLGTPLGDFVLGDAGSVSIVSFSDTITWVDSIVSYSEQISDILVFTETIVCQKISTPTFSDSITWSDAFYRSLVASISESITWSETWTYAKFKNVSFSDTYTITDITSVNYIAFLNLFDTLPLNDTLTRIVRRNKDFSDAITWSDSIIGIVPKIFSDTITWSETYTPLFSKGIKDILNYGEVVNRQAILNRPLNSILEWAELYNPDFVLFKPITDSLTWSESLTGYRTRQISDTLSYIETWSCTKAYPLREDITWSDEYTFNRTTQHRFTDTLVIADSAQVSFVLSRNILDELRYFELMNKIRAKSASISDTLTWSDNLLRQVFPKTLADILSWSETYNLDVIFNRSNTDNLTLSDQLITTNTLNLTLTDNLILNEDYFCKSTNNVVIRGFTKDVCLPAPELNDFEVPQNKVVLKRTMSARYKTHVKTSKRTKFNWTFILTKQEANELYDFWLAEQVNTVRLETHTGERYNVELLTDSLDFNEVAYWQGGNKVEVTLEMVGTKV